MIRIAELITLLMIGILPFSVLGQKEKDTVGLADQVDTLSYIIGRDVGTQLKNFETEIRMSAFAQGVDEALKGIASVIDSMKADSIRQAFATEVQQKLVKKQMELAEKNKKESDAFLANNKKRSGVKTTKSGLQYKVIKYGKGDRPAANDSVMVSYKGMLTDSTVFDSTVTGPATLDLSKTIPGLAEGIKLMKVGSKYRFFVPPDLAYGPTGIPPQIPPNAVLIFDVELKGISGKKHSSLGLN